MKNSTLTLALLVSVMRASSAYAEPSLTQTADEREPFSIATVERIRLEVKELIAEKKYLRAQKNLAELLETPDLPEDLKRKIEDSYLKLNRKILFSKYETPDSVMHEVVSGDSLHKIAKKYKTSVGFIKRVNGLKKDVILLGSKLKIPQGDFRTSVDVSQNLLTIYFNDKPIQQYTVGTGSDETPTPIGTFKITDKLENPTWYKTGAVVPPGSPENGLGTRWLGFDKKGYGIHGTNEPDSIGKHESSGCIRMLNKNVEELYALLPSGSEVKVVR